MSTATRMAGEGATYTLPSDREVVFTRVYDAPRSLVFEAWTTPEHVRRWYGCGAMAVTVCEIDLRPGGAWRYVIRSPDGQEYAMSGVYREIVRPERLVYTERFEPVPGAEALVTVTFEENEGRTTFTCTVTSPEGTSNEAVAATGVLQGTVRTLDYLAEVLETMRS